MKGPYITEAQLRERFSLGYGTEIRLDAGSRLTPSAEGLLADRKISIKYQDEEGRVFLKKSEASPADTSSSIRDGNADLKKVNPLTGQDGWSLGSCTLCHQLLQAKPETLTHIDLHNLVSKNDPRLRFRGKLDSVIALTVLIQTQMQEEGFSHTRVLQYLNDVRSALGNVLKAEATGSEMAGISLGELNEKVIHTISHNPLKYLGHDHLLPEVGQGMNVARLNVLRAQIREAELDAADIYITQDLKVTRPDIMSGLNRLSSAVYVLMLLTFLVENGKTIDLERMKP